MAVDPELRAHQEWLGYLQPVGLVVSPPALAHAGAFVNRNIVREQQTLLRLVHRESVRRADGRAERNVLTDLPGFCTEFLGWEARDLAGGPGGTPLPPELAIALPEYGETLAPTYAVPDPEHEGRWLLLVQELPRGADLDSPLARDERGWHASPQARLERLLRETGIAIGVVSNGEAIRLVHAPRVESSGHLTFPVAAMCEVAGRPIVSALHMLLCAERLFALPSKQRLPALLHESRKYQNDVSTKLAEQVLAALNELLRGFQAANEASSGTLLRDALDEDPSLVYGGLLATLLRLVFVLYAEDRGLLPGEGIYAEHYSVTVTCSPTLVHSQ